MKHYQLFKLRAVLLLFALFCSMPNVWATPAYITGNSGPMWEYDSSTKTLIISGEGDMGFLNGDFTNNCPWKNYRNEIEKLIIESGITSICTGAFQSLSFMKSVSIPTTVTKIWDSAFEGCQSLTSISIPEGVTHILSRAFCSCYSLKTLMIPSSVTQINSDTFLASQSITDVYCNIDLSRYLTWTNNKYYNNNCFKQSKGTIFHVYNKEPWETSYSFINVTFVGDLENVSKLKGTVDAEETNVTLKVNMEDAASLNGELVIPTNYSDGVNSYQVTALGDKAFADCTGLTSVTIPSSVKAIGDKAFAGCI